MNPRADAQLGLTFAFARRLLRQWRSTAQVSMAGRPIPSGGQSKAVAKQVRRQFPSKRQGRADVLAVNNILRSTRDRLQRLEY